jgi:hypothetical protein
MPTIDDSARIADRLIASEIATQDKMWDRDNSAADYSNGELMHAAQASTFLSILQAGAEGPLNDAETAYAENLAKNAFYPETWSGFRDYGKVYNLIVAAAFLRNQAKLMIAAGEDYARKPRKPDQTYNAETGLPLVSSAEARGE